MENVQDKMAHEFIDTINKSLVNFVGLSDSIFSDLQCHQKYAAKWFYIINRKKHNQSVYMCSIAVAEWHSLEDKLTRVCVTTSSCSINSG